MRKIKLYTKPGKVEHSATIRGKARPPINVWVLSNDGQYYLQDEPTWHGNKFSVECKFGFEDIADDLLGYEAFVVQSCDRPHSPQPALPEGCKESIRVFRVKE